MRFIKYFLISQAVVLLSYAGSSYIQPPSRPVYETCKMVTGWNDTQVPDPACTSRNGQKKRDYDYAVNTYNRSQNMVNNTSTGANKPVEPNYESCQQEDYACGYRNSKLRNEYNLQMQSYNRVQNEQAAAAQAQTAEQQRMATVNNTTTTGMFNEIEGKNRSAQQIYQIASQACGAVSTAYSAAYAASCARMGGCEQPHLTKAIAFQILSAIGGRQAGEHAASGLSACNSYNSVYSSQKDCTPSPVVTDPSVVLGNNFDPNGKCTGDPKICKDITDKLPAGVTIKDVKDALAKKNPLPYKVNPDGSVTTKDGKTYSAKDFASEDAMRAAGLSAADAKTLAGMLKGNALAAAGTDLEKLNEADKLKNSGLNSGLASGFGSGSDSNSKTGEMNDLGNGGKLGNKDDFKNRKPAATTGLVKNFNGESIGVAGEDIFIMMNRRYKLKTSQDSFIGK